MEKESEFRRERALKATGETIVTALTRPLKEQPETVRRLRAEFKRRETERWKGRASEGSARDRRAKARAGAPFVHLRPSRGKPEELATIADVAGVAEGRPDLLPHRVGRGERARVQREPTVRRAAESGRHAT